MGLVNGCTVNAYNMACSAADVSDKINFYFTNEHQTKKIKMMLKGNINKASELLGISPHAIKIFRYLFKHKLISTIDIESYGNHSFIDSVHNISSTGKGFEVKIKITNLY